MFNTVKIQLVDEFFMIKDDQDVEIIQRYKDLKEEVLQNFRTFDNIKNTLYTYKWQVQKLNRNSDHN